MKETEKKIKPQHFGAVGRDQILSSGHPIITMKMWQITGEDKQK
jgi:hypothetical protein